MKASPATRRKAREAGIDLRQVPGSGPSGRIMPKDFEAAMSGAAPAGTNGGAAAAPSLLRQRTGTDEIKVIGVRRVIAQRMTDAARTIPHFAYVEEVDVTELESLRAHLNSKAPKGTPALTYLPFLAAALARVLEEFPQCNAHYDAERNVLIRHRRGAPGRGDADAGRPQGAGRAPRRSPHALGPVGRDPPRLRGRARAARPRARN